MIPHASVLKRRLLSAELTLYFADDSEASLTDASTLSHGGKNSPESIIGRSDAGAKATDVEERPADVEMTEAGKAATNVSTSEQGSGPADIKMNDTGRRALDVGTIDEGNRPNEEYDTDVESDECTDDRYFDSDEFADSSTDIKLPPTFSWNDKTNTGKKIVARLVSLEI